MDSTYFLVMAVPALGWLAAAASPAVVLMTRPRYSPAHVASARRMLRSSAFVVAVSMCHIADVSFASHAVNVIVEGAALLFGLGLVAFLFVLRPRLFGIVAGLYALAAWLLLTLFLSFGALIDGAREVRMQDGIICRAESYGFLISESGFDVRLFRRFLFVDYRIAAHLYSDISPDDNDLVYPAKAALKRCLATASAPVVVARGK